MEERAASSPDDGTWESFAVVPQSDTDGARLPSPTDDATHLSTPLSEPAAGGGDGAAFVAGNLQLLGFARSIAPFAGVRELLDNAMDAGANDVNLRLVEAVSRPATMGGAGGGWMLTVSDNGFGMSTEHVPRLVASIFASTKTVVAVATSTKATAGTVANGASDVASRNRMSTHSMGQYGIGLKALVLYAQAALTEAASSAAAAANTTLSLALETLARAPLLLVTAAAGENASAWAVGIGKSGCPLVERLRTGAPLVGGASAALAGGLCEAWWTSAAISVLETNAADRRASSHGTTITVALAGDLPASSIASLASMFSRRALLLQDCTLNAKVVWAGVAGAEPLTAVRRGKSLPLHDAVVAIRSTGHSLALSWPPTSTFRLHAEPPWVSPAVVFEVSDAGFAAVSATVTDATANAVSCSVEFRDDAAKVDIVAETTRHIARALGLSLRCVASATAEASLAKSSSHSLVAVAYVALTPHKKSARTRLLPADCTYGVKGVAEDAEAAAIAEAAFMSGATAAPVYVLRFVGGVPLLPPLGRAAALAGCSIANAALHGLNWADEAGLCVRALATSGLAPNSRRRRCATGALAARGGADGRVVAASANKRQCLRQSAPPLCASEPEQTTLRLPACERKLLSLQPAVPATLTAGSAEQLVDGGALAAKSSSTSFCPGVQLFASDVDDGDALWATATEVGDSEGPALVPFQALRILIDVRTTCNDVKSLAAGTPRPPPPVAFIDLAKTGVAGQTTAVRLTAAAACAEEIVAAAPPCDIVAEAVTAALRGALAALREQLPGILLPSRERQIRMLRRVLLPTIAREIAGMAGIARRYVDRLSLESNVGAAEFNANGASRTASVAVHAKGQRLGNFSASDATTTTPMYTKACIKQEDREAAVVVFTSTDETGFLVTGNDDVADWEAGVTDASLSEPMRSISDVLGAYQETISSNCREICSARVAFAASCFKEVAEAGDNASESVRAGIHSDTAMELFLLATLERRLHIISIRAIDAMVTEAAAVQSTDAAAASAPANLTTSRASFEVAGTRSRVRHNSTLVAAAVAHSLTFDASSSVGRRRREILATLQRELVLFRNEVHLASRNVERIEGAGGRNRPTRGVEAKNPAAPPAATTAAAQSGNFGDSDDVAAWIMESGDGNDSSSEAMFLVSGGVSHDNDNDGAAAVADSADRCSDDEWEASTAERN